MSRRSIALAVLAAVSWAPRVSAHQDGPPPEAPRPNVLFVAVDDLNDWVGFLGGHPQVRTPHFDRLARRGVVFANAHCAAPLCCPSRAAVFSGRHPFRTGILENHHDLRKKRPDLALIPQHFKGNGYVTLGTGKLLHRRRPDLFDRHFFTEQRWSPFARQDVEYTPEELPTKGKKPRHVIPGSIPGSPRDPRRPPVVLPLNGMPSDRSPNDRKGESFDWGPLDVADGAMGDARVADWAAGHLRRESDRPFFLAVGFYRPHIPLFAPRKYFEGYPVESTTVPRVPPDDLDDLGETGRRRALEAVTAGLHETVVKYGEWKAA
ncbi:MAG: sulfatase-like hydrolase/transferase, partial [Planctomycetota bacterium]|nr:sulfatase-like hydrolase/transferase [Planctomycetota bacterium]